MSGYVRIVPATKGGKQPQISSMFSTHYPVDFIAKTSKMSPSRIWSRSTTMTYDCAIHHGTPVDDVAGA